MTRLSTEFLIGIGANLNGYDRELFGKAGYTLRQIASRAAGVTGLEVCGVAGNIRVAVVPITSGKGIIKGFSEAVRSIINYLGFKVFVTKNYDVGGFAEGIERGAEVIFLADDDRFVALNLPYRKVVDNTEATGRGYIVALEGMRGNLRDCSVLVIGAGRVGRSATCALKELGAKVAVFDIYRTKAEILAREHNVMVERNLDKALHKYTTLIDASPAPNIIQAEHIKPTTVIAAPGIPLGLSDEALSLVKDRLVHDPLQIGVATMLVMSVLDK